MAFYYTQEGQPIPYDIALLAQLRGELGDSGILRAHVPAVSKRYARTEAEQEYSWTRSATPSAVVRWEDFGLGCDRAGLSLTIPPMTIYSSHSRIDRSDSPPCFRTVYNARPGGSA